VTTLCPGWVNTDMAVEAASKGDHRVDAEALRAEADAWQKIYEHAKNDRAVHMAHAISAYCAHVLALERALERALAAERRARQAGGAS
jgi:short-subunit dehydrogenase